VDVVENFDRVGTVPDQSCAIGSDPDAPIRALCKGIDIPETGDPSGEEFCWLELNAVEADESPERTDPEEAISRLEQSTDAVMRQALVNSPVIEMVALEFLNGVQAERLVAKKENEEEELYDSMWDHEFRNFPRVPLDGIRYSQMIATINAAIKEIETANSLPDRNGNPGSGSRS
jgi:hypothetical protein